MSKELPPPGTAIIFRKKNFLANDPNVDIPAEVVRPVGATILVRLVDENKEAYIPTKWFTSKASNLACVPPIISLPHYFQIKTTNEADSIFKHPMDNPPITDVVPEKKQPTPKKMPTENKPLIFSKIIAVMKDVESIGKNQTAEAFSFRGIEDVYNAIHPLFKAHGIFMTTEVLTQSNNAAGKTILNAKFTFFAEDGSSVSSTVCGEAISKDDKGSTIALSVAQRIALTQMFLIPTDDREWLGQAQFQKALLRINGGDKELLPKLQKEYRIKADHLKILQEADKKKNK